MTDDLAARIETRLAAALDHQEGGGFITTLPALCGEDGEPRIPLEQIARIAAEVATARIGCWPPIPDRTEVATDPQSMPS